MKSNHTRMMKIKRAVGLVQDATISVDQAIDAVSHLGGIIYDVRLKQTDGRVVWRVKMVRDGERAKIYVDANSGVIRDAKAETAVTERNFF